MNKFSNEKKTIINEFTELLPTLRTRFGITQEELAVKIDTTRQTIISIEKKKRTLTWAMFLAMVFIFFMDNRTRPLLIAVGITGEKLSEILFDNEAIIPRAAFVLEQNKPMIIKAQEMINITAKKEEE